MDEQIKKQLDALLAADKERIARAEKARDEEADARAAFAAAFAEKCERIIAPALTDFGDYIKSGGWNSEVTVRNEHPGHAEYRNGVDPGRGFVAKMLFFRGETRPSIGLGMEVPEFSIRASKLKNEVIIFECTGCPNHGCASGATGGYSLDALTTDNLQQLLLNYFKKLIESAHPVASRS